MPALKAVLDSLDELPEALRAVGEQLYTARDGKFYLDAEVPPGDLDKLKRVVEHERRQRAELAKRAEAAEAELEKERAARNGAPPPPPDAAARQDAVWQKRIDKLEALMNEERTKRESAEARLAEQKITEALRAVGARVGVDEPAMVDFLNRARPIWRLNERGEPTAFEGELEVSGMTMDQQAEQIVKDAPHLLRRSNGSGAGGGGHAAARGGIVMVTRDQLRDAQEYQRITADAEKRGATIMIADKT